MLQDAADAAARAAELFLSKVQGVFLSTGGSLSLAQLGAAFLIAVGAAVLLRRAKGKTFRIRAFLKALFVRRIVFSRSSTADYKLAFFNLFLAGALFGWAVLSHHTISVWTNDTLIALFGASEPSALPAFATGAVMTVALYLAYEFAYWADHCLSHKTPFLWEFHKVHHQAETLTPITNFRVHPVDSIVFYNILALCTGLTQGLTSFAFGAEPTTFSGSNIFFLIFAFTTLHLQHSHVWIAFTGFWGRVFMSPAHHQIHHSRDALHFDRNFGSSLAVFDWLFGTLHVPQKTREKLTFGVEPEGHDPHTVPGMLIAPFARAASRLQEPRPETAPGH